MNDSTSISKRTTRTLLAITALGCFSVLLAGCQPTLSFEKKYTLTAGEIVALPIDPVGSEQTIHVSAITTDDASFAVHVYLKKDEDRAERVITTGAASNLILAESTNTKTVNLSAKIPADEGAVVRFSAANMAVTVNVAINN